MCVSVSVLTVKLHKKKLPTLMYTGLPEESLTKEFHEKSVSNDTDAVCTQQYQDTLT
jgi:hypothetical protein